MQRAEQAALVCGGFSGKTVHSRGHKRINHANCIHPGAYPGLPWTGCQSITESQIIWISAFISELEVRVV